MSLLKVQYAYRVRIHRAYYWQTRSILLISDIELNMLWTNHEWADDEVIASFRAHGECEQYHSELKTDIDVDRLPSGKCTTNALMLELAMTAYNLLQMIGQESLKHKQPEKRKVRRRRLRIVLSNLMLREFGWYGLFQYYHLLGKAWLSFSRYASNHL